MCRTGANEPYQKSMRYQRTLTEREVIDKQSTWKRCCSGKVYQVFSGLDFPVIMPLDFITKPHSQNQRSWQAGQDLDELEKSSENITNWWRWASSWSGLDNNWVRRTWAFVRIRGWYPVTVAGRRQRSSSLGVRRQDSLYLENITIQPHFILYFIRRYARVDT